MRHLNFAVRFTKELLIKDSKQEISRITLTSGETLGFISVFNNNDEEVTVPFTENGEMPPAHCASCAVRALFALRANLPYDAVAIAEDVEPVTTRDFLRLALSQRRNA